MKLTRHVAPALACAALLAGCSATGRPPADHDHELADALAGRVAGPPTDCIDQIDTQTVRIIAPDTVIYSSVGKRIYVNHVPDCPALRPYSTLITVQHGSQLCRLDHFRVAEPGSSIPSGYCTLGQFTPYTNVASAHR